MSLVGPAVDVANKAVDALKSTPACLALVLLAGGLSWLTYLDNKGERDRIWQAAQDERRYDREQNDKLLDRCLAAYETRESRNEADRQHWRDKRRALHEKVDPQLQTPEDRHDAPQP